MVDRMAEQIYDQYRGALMGLAVGDALGAPFEGLSRGTFGPIETMAGGGPRNLKPGQWTGNTSMALCLAASLTECRGFDPRDQMDRYLRWKNEGYLSSTGHAFGLGEALRGVLRRYQETGDPWAGLADPLTADSGSLARLAPIPMYMFLDGSRAKELAAAMSRTTHAAEEAVDACRYLTGLMVGAFRGESKEALLSDHYSPVYHYWFFPQIKLDRKVAAIAAGSYKQKEAEDLPASGYVIDTLEAALWCFWRTRNFRDGALLAAGLGNDAASTAAVYGQLAGAYYGVQAIPGEWRETVAEGRMIEALAASLLEATRQGIRHLTAI
jgi:ADP-ribosyl-[dinitrogen reductase] hydrolase